MVQAAQTNYCGSWPKNTSDMRAKSFFLRVHLLMQLHARSNRNEVFYQSNRQTEILKIISFFAIAHLVFFWTFTLCYLQG